MTRKVREFNYSRPVGTLVVFFYQLHTDPGKSQKVSK